ncbi:MAG: response regulator [Alphaproteobacteria bacterium]
MNQKILFVDDDTNLLASMKRQLRRQHVIETASSGLDALFIIKSQPAFAVVVSDMRMPGMNGIEFLKAVKEVSPSTVRMLLTGHADLQTAVDAVNEGSIFRILSKPCQMELLESNINAALEQHRLVTAERVLLERTLVGSVSIMFQILSMTVPEAFGRANLVRDWVRRLPDGLVGNVWQLEIAAMLAPLGMATIPGDVVTAAELGGILSEKNKRILAGAPQVAHDLIVKIPRLESVAEIVLLQDKGFDGSGYPPEGPEGVEIPTSARILKILQDLSKATVGFSPASDAFAQLEARQELYDPVLLQSIRQCLEVLPGEGESKGGVVWEIPFARLSVDDILAANLELVDGQVVLSAGTRINASTLDRLSQLGKVRTIREPVKIKAPQPDAEAEAETEREKAERRAAEEAAAASQKQVAALLDRQAHERDDAGPG